MAKAIHSMIRVFNEQTSIDFYKKAFDLSVADRLDFDSFTLVYLSNSESTFELELTINKDQTEPYDLGSGYGHLAVSVDNLETEHQKMTDLGYSPRKIVEFEREGTLFAKFFFITDPDGYEIEVLQRHGRFI
jgi:lactoylglutathione lyase